MPFIRRAFIVVINQKSSVHQKEKKVSQTNLFKVHFWYL